MNDEHKHIFFFAEIKRYTLAAPDFTFVCECGAYKEVRGKLI